MSAVYLLDKSSNELERLTRNSDSGDEDFRRKKETELLFQWEDWGRDTEDGGPLVLNESWVLRRVSNREELFPFLRNAGIPCESSKHAFSRSYFVALFQFRVLGVWRMFNRFSGEAVTAAMRPKLGKEVHPEQYTSRELRNVIRLASRTLYTVGLDFGGVSVGVTGENNCMVRHLQPSPKVRENLASRYTSAFHRFARSWREEKTSFLMGADLELILRHRSGKFLFASDFFSYRGRIGYDALPHPKQRNKHPILEIRPKPAESARQLYRNTYHLLKKALLQLSKNKIQILCGALPSKGFPIGGHLHFSQVPLTFQVVRTLDNYLALPLRCIEDPKGSARRPRYGFLGDVRKKMHGFEYRTLPSFLFSPRLTLAVYALAQFIVEHHKELPALTPLPSYMQEAYYQQKTPVLLDWFRQRRQDLERLPAYAEVAKEIQPLFDCILQQQVWNESYDIRTFWEL